MEPGNLPGFTAEDVEMALLQFYKGPKGPLDSWLTAAQSSKEAWFFCWQLLQIGKPMEVQYYGANALLTKIDEFWHEVPEDEIDNLRTNLLQLLETHLMSPRMIVTKICISISCFILQTISDHWPEALKVLMAVIETRDNDPKQCIQKGNILEILTVLPEEFNRMYFPPVKKTAIRTSLWGASDSVMEMLYKILTEMWPSEAIKIQAIKCFSSWVQIGADLTQPEKEPLINLIFELVGNQTYFPETVEVIPFMFKCSINYKVPRLAMKCIKKVIQLEPLFIGAQQNLDFKEACFSLAKIFVSAAENNISLIISSIASSVDDGPYCLELLRLISNCVTVKGYFPVDESCSDCTFGFWYNLQDQIAQSEEPLSLVNRFREIYIELFASMTFKTRYPPDIEYATWNTDEQEAFRCYRQDFADAAAYFSNFIGSASMNLLYSMLKGLITKHGSSGDVSWQEFECIIYMMTSVMEGYNIQDGSCVSHVFEVFPHVPCNNNTLITQIMYFIASCADFMEDNLQMFTASIPFLLKGLSDKDLCSAASMSLKDVFYANRKYIGLVSTEVIEAIKNALESGNLKSSDVIRVVGCLGHVISNLPQDTAFKVITVILSPHIQLLLKYANLTQLNNQSQSIIVEKLKMLSNLYSSYAPPDEEGENAQMLPHQKSQQCVFVMVHELIPLITQLLQNHSHDEIIMNELFEMIKRAIRALLADFSPFVQEFSKLIITAYNHQPNPCMIDTAKSMMVLFANDEQHKAVIQFMFTSICNRSLHFFEQNSSYHPDVMEALMSFLTQMIKKNPSLLKDESCNLSGLFAAATVGVLMNEAPISKSSCLFLASLILSIDINDIVLTQGMKLLEVIFVGIAGRMPRMNLNPLADVLLALGQKHFDLFSKTMNEFVLIDEFPHAQVTRADKQQFVKSLMTSHKNKRKLKELVNEYGLLWRRLIDTEYAVQTSNSSLPFQ